MQNKFLENFLDLCQDSNKKQSELALEIGINQSQISRYQKGILPDTKTVVKICDYFKCSIDYIVGLNDNYSYPNSVKGIDINAFYPKYNHLLQLNHTTHYQLAKKGLICETSLRLWKKGVLPAFEALYNIAIELGTSIDSLLGKVD